MATKTISTVVTSTVSFDSTYRVISITPSGYVDTSVGAVAIDGPTAGYIDTLVNDGRILGGVYLGSGGEVANGSAAQTGASILAGGSAVFIRNAIGTVANYGTITALQGGTAAGVYLNAGGTITNGSGADTRATIIGGYGVHIRNALGTVVNYGTIVATDKTGGHGAYMSGGLLTNGTAVDTTALISGSSGVFIRGAAATVNNFATIESTNAYAIACGYGCVVTNGSATDRTALIDGFTVGVDLQADGGTVVNFGTIEGQGASPGDPAVYLSTGKLINGGGTDHGALIQGYLGVVLRGQGTVSNYATIQALGGVDQYGLYVGGGGSFTNGGANDRGALIEGFGGVELEGTLSGVNFGTIEATGVSSGVGAVVNTSSGQLTNGAANDTGALIEGYVGADVGAGGVLVNFGTIAGYGGEAVYGTSAKATLVVEAGSVFIGSVIGGGGTVDLGSGVGTVSGLAGGNVTASGAIATTTFQDFGTVEVGAGAAFTLSGNASIATGDELVVAGALSAAGSITSAGALLTSGTLSGAGTLALTGGTARFNNGTVLTLAKVTESGATTTAIFATPTLTLADVWTQAAGTVSVLTGDRVNFTGTGDAFSGTLSGAGTVGFTGGTDTLSGTQLTATSVVIDGAAVSLSGAIGLTGVASITSPSVVIAAAGATFSGGGTISLSNAATNIIKGASASAELTNSDCKIEGAGQLGDGEMALTNDAGGTIEASLSTALTINLGATTLANAGIVENISTGGLVVDGAVNNTGTLEALTKGTLTVDGAVTGAGTVRISGGTADFGGAFTENVTFTTTGGVLELAKSASYTGKITGFAKTPVSSLDLLDITFGTKTKATFSGTTTSGVLTVTDGTRTSKITLVGNYTTSTFTAASDGHGGTTITDPTKAASPPTPPWRIGPEPVVLITAMAAFGVRAGDTVESAHEALGRSSTLLWVARPQVA